MKRLVPLLAAAILACGTTSGRSPRELHLLQEALLHHIESHDDDVTQNIQGSWIDERAGCVRVDLLNGSDAALSRFRRYFPDTSDYRVVPVDFARWPLPAAAAPDPEVCTMHAERYYYADTTRTIRITIVHRGPGLLQFGSDYRIGRFDGREWRPSEQRTAFTQPLYELAPSPAGSRHSFDVQLLPLVRSRRCGRFRIYKEAQLLEGGTSRTVVLTAEFYLAPFVPFTPVPTGR